jgi:hypothetical protein
MDDPTVQKPAPFTIKISELIATNEIEMSLREAGLNAAASTGC